MANLILSSVWVNGDVMPFIWLGQKLLERGHRVSLLTNSYYIKIANQAGLNAYPVDNEIEFSEFINNGALFNTPSGFKTVYRKYVLPTLQTEFNLIKNLAQPQTAVICRATPGIAAKSAAEMFKTRLIQVFLGPSYVTTIPLVEEMFHSFLKDDINEFRKHNQLPPVSDWANWLRKSHINLGLWPEWFNAGNSDFPIPVTYGGFVNNPNSDDIPDDILRFLSVGSPPILITGGSSVLSGAEFFNAAIEGCRIAGRRAIVVSRHSHLLPAIQSEDHRQWSQVPSLPAIMRKCAAIIHHGGLITSIEALSAGIPQLGLVFGGDRPDNTLRLKKLGVGEILPRRDWNSAEVAVAIIKLIDTVAVTQACSLYKEKMVTERNSCKVCDQIEAVFKAPVSEWGAESVENPTPEVTSNSSHNELIKSLSPAKRALLEERLRMQRTSANIILPQVSRGKTSYRYEASYTQQGFWIIEQTLEAEGTYNLPAAYRIRGSFDLQLLNKAITRLARRHDLLRATFIEENGILFQVVREPSEQTVPRIDLTHLSPHAAHKEVEQIIPSEASRKFDFTHGPMFRPFALKLAAQEHVFIFNIHHIISDGISIAVLTQDILKYYEIVGSNAIEEAPPSLQFADFTRWQKELLSGSVLTQRLKYWKERLQKPLARAELPSDFPRLPVQSFRGGSINGRISNSLVSDLRLVAKTSRGTLFIVLTAILNVWLYRHTHERDITLGCVSGARVCPELDRIVGCFVNIVVLRSAIDPAESFMSFLHRFRDSVVADLENQDLPYQKLLENVAPERLGRHDPLFQVMFAFQSIPPLKSPHLEMSIEPLNIPSSFSKFDLSVFAAETTDGLELSFEYNADLYRRSTVERWLDRFITLVGAIAENCDSAIGEFAITSLKEQQMLFQMASGAKQRTLFNVAFEAVDQWADRTPNHCAISASQRRITYSELRSISNQFASYLQRLGVRRQNRVVVLLPCSPELILTALAIQKTGGVYVPLDPDSKEDRLKCVLHDLEPTLIVTDREHSHSLGAYTSKIVVWEDILDQVYAEPAASIGWKPNLEDLAYIIYTSGSTGIPKGVMVSYGAVWNLLAWHLGEYQVKQSDRATVIAGPSFDASIWEILPYLTAGATLYIPGEEVRTSPQGLLDYFSQHRITFAFVPTPLAELVLQLSWNGGDLRFLLTGGDTLKQAHRNTEHWTLVNHYGPTENTVVSTSTKVDRGLLSIAPPIGRPIWNCSVYVLDSQMECVPLGVTGELYLTGASLAMGYWREPRMTAAKFFPCGFEPVFGSRMYQTGDLVVFDERGDLHFKGRSDQQIKIRGFRVELGEVECALAQALGVQEAAAAFQEIDGQKQLVAYIVPTIEWLGAKELKRELSSKIPHYMLPSKIFLLERLPQTPNGKINRRMLSPALATASVNEESRTLTEEERVIADIWESLLNVPVGPEDDFFILGGHSLIAMQVASRITAETYVVIGLKEVFEHPSVEALTRYLARKRSQHEESAKEMQRLQARVAEMSDAEVSDLLEKKMRKVSIQS